MPKMTKAQKNALAVARAQILGKPKPKGGNGSRRRNPSFFAVRKGGPTKGFAGVVNNTSKLAAQAALIAGSSAPVTGILTGRTVLRPLGGYHVDRPPNADGTISTVKFRNPFLNTESDAKVILVDAVKRFSGEVTVAGQPAGIGGQFRAGMAAVSYNGRSMFQRGTRAALFGPVVAGFAAKWVDRVITPMIVGSVKGMTQAATGLGRSFGGGK